MNRKDYTEIKIKQPEKYKISAYPDELYECYCNGCRNNTEHRTIVKATKTENFDDDGCLFSIYTYRIIEFKFSCFFELLPRIERSS